MMEAGRELDALVAEKVMGAVPNGDVPPYWFVEENGKLRLLGSWDDGWHPSTDISAAWEVVEKLAAQDYRFGISGPMLDGAWGAFFQWVRPGHSGEFATHGNHEYPCLAICLAALKVVE